jgi:uncharacterized protein
VKYQREFVLPIAGLSLGNKHYTFELGRQFLELYDDSEILDCEVYVDLLFDKRENMIEMNFNMKGWLEVPCDRCADEYHQEIEGRQTLILKYGDHFEEESDEIIIIPSDLHEFDVSQLIYEYMVLLLPIRKVHPEDEDGNSGCNPEVIKRLEELRVEEQNDPRWEVLKNLKS